MHLIDRYLPTYHFSETHARLVSAPPAAILTAVAAYRAETDWFFRVMIRLRESPARLVGRRDARRASFNLDAFTLLARNEGEIVYGLIGRFWRLDFSLAPVDDGADFLGYDQGDAAKLALTFRTHPHSDGRTRLVTETRVACPSRSARWKFAPYWYGIRPVSGLVRRRTLAAVARDSERSAWPARTATAAGSP